MTTEAKKWVTQWNKCDEIKHKWEAYDHRGINGLTNVKVGPPTYLDALTKGRWKAQMIDTLRGCIKTFLIPHGEKALQERWQKLKRHWVEKLTEGGGSRGRQFTEQVSGIINKNSKGNSSKLRPIPPPPPPATRTKQTNINTQRVSSRGEGEGIAEETIGTLRRGEACTPISDRYMIQEEGGYAKDITILLGWAIYGCRHRENFIVRSIIKYMDMYSKREREAFKQEKVRLKNGRIIICKQYEAFRNSIQKKLGYMGRYELTILASLYQIQIRIFRKYNNMNTDKIGLNNKTLKNTTHNIEKELSNPIGDIAYSEIDRESEVSEYRKGVEGITFSDLVSDNSSIDLIDIHPGLKHMKYAERTQGHGVEQEHIPQVSMTQEAQADKNSARQENNNTHNTGTAQHRESTSTGNDSISTTSSVAALFIDKKLEKANITEELRRKKITRRKVWDRWRNIVRGKHRKEAKHTNKLGYQQKRIIDNRKLVFDYTTHTLTEPEISILSKGETFCTVDYKIDEDRNRVDIYKYQRRLRLHEQFRDPDITEQDDNTQRTSIHTPVRRRSTINTPIQTRRSRHSIRTQTQTCTHTRQSTTCNNDTKSSHVKARRLPSTYDPQSNNRNLNRYNNCIQEEISLAMQDKTIPFRDNIPRVERIAIKNLKERIARKDIIVTKADKGSGVVVVDYDKYVKKGTDYIEKEAKAYTKAVETEQTIVTRLVKARNKLAESLKEHQIISTQTATYITKQLEEKITGIKFYYKIHKDTNIDTMPLRPLQSCIKAPTQHLSIVLTDILQPLLNTTNIPTFISDTNQLLFRLHKLGNIPAECTLISSDVSALYPSIPHAQGFLAINTFLKDKTSFTELQLTSIIKALELVITENYITWNKHVYKQTSGVAMGTPVAVAYANIFMNWVDQEISKQAPYIHEHIRYIDDNLFIIPTSKIESLMTIANNILPPFIKFTYEKLDNEADVGLPFLDTQLSIAHNYTIQSRLYTKKTDRHAYLLPTSYHPPHITHNIPAAVFGRIKKICSTQEWFQEDAEKAKEWLLNRAYKKADINKALQKVSMKDRWSMIEEIEKKRSQQTPQKEEHTFEIPLVITYNQHSTHIKNILKRRQPLLNSAFRKTKVKPRLAYRRQRNLNDILIQKGLRGPIDTIDKDKNIFTECGETQTYKTRCPCNGKHRQDRCRCCSHSQPKVEKVKQRIHKPVNCNSKNIVYAIGCKQCNKQYVGETQQRLKDRLAQHMYNINKLNQPLYLHFRYTHKPENLYITILETVKGEEPIFRKIREAWWINHLQSLEPRGLNAKLDCNQIYTEGNSQT